MKKDLETNHQEVNNRALPWWLSAFRPVREAVRRNACSISTVPNRCKTKNCKDLRN